MPVVVPIVIVVVMPVPPPPMMMAIRPTIIVIVVAPVGSIVIVAVVPMPAIPVVVAIPRQGRQRRPGKCADSGQRGDGFTHVEIPPSDLDAQISAVTSSPLAPRD